MPKTQKKIKPVKPQAVTVIRLREILEERELVPDQAVKLCREKGFPVTRTTIYNLCNPIAKGVRLDTITALCIGLGIPVSELIVTKQVSNGN